MSSFSRSKLLQKDHLNFFDLVTSVTASCLRTVFVIRVALCFARSIVSHIPSIFVSILPFPVAIFSSHHGSFAPCQTEYPPNGSVVVWFSLILLSVYPELQSSAPAVLVVYASYYTSKIFGVSTLYIYTSNPYLPFFDARLQRSYQKHGLDEVEPYVEDTAA